MSSVREKSPQHKRKNSPRLMFEAQ